MHVASSIKLIKGNRIINTANVIDQIRGSTSRLDDYDLFSSAVKQKVISKGY